MAARQVDAREARFIDEYLIDLDPKRAAIAAGYSASLAASKAYQWVSNGKVKPHVFAEIERRQKILAAKTGITQERVLQELAKVGFASMRRFVQIDGSGEPVINMADTPDDELDSLSEVQTETRYERDTDGEGEMRPIRKVRIKLHDKLAALDKIARHLGMFVDKVEHTGKDGAPLIPERSDIEVARGLAFLLAKGTQEVDKNG